MTATKFLVFLMRKLIAAKTTQITNIIIIIITAIMAVTPRLRLVLDGRNFCKAHKARDRDRSTQNLRFSKFYMKISHIQNLR